MSGTQAEKFERLAADKDKQEKPRRGRRYWVRRAMIDVLIGYVLICLVLFIFQERFVYQPSTESALAPRDHGFGAQQARAVQTRTSDGVTLNGWQINGGKHPLPPLPAARGAPQAQPAATTARGTGPFDLSQAPLVGLFFCGNAGNRGDRGSTFALLTSCGADVVCFDYRGYGDSEGSPDEEGLARDARAAWEFLIQQGAKPQNIVIHGESLGGAVAVRLAAELCAAGTPPGGLIVQATFTRMKDVAAKHYWFLPVSLILRQRFPSVERIPGVTCPLLMLHGRRDGIVPFALGQELYAAAPAQSSGGVAKRFVELPDCGHNDIGMLNTVEYLDAVGDFYGALCPALALRKSSEITPRPPREKTARPPRPPQKTGAPPQEKP
ncbi:MAG: alpha/beta hydrolase [Planctomycetota bacterium]|nr:alpha/beta hydrolase [Planctomycetota bacterium]